MNEKVHKDLRKRLKDLHNRLKDADDFEVFEYQLNEIEVKDICEFFDLFLYD